MSLAPRRISTKWVLTVLAAVVVPFLAFAWYVNTQVAKSQLERVRYYLLSIAGEMAGRIDYEVEVRRQQLSLLVKALPVTEWAVGDYVPNEREVFGVVLRGGFDRFIRDARVFDRILAVDAGGQLVVANTVDGVERDLAAENEALRSHDFTAEPWFVEAMRGQVALVDHHVTPFVPRRVDTSRPHPENYHVGFAIPVFSQVDPARTVGVVYGLMNWSHVQNRVLRTVRPRGTGREVPDVYRTSYAWLWASDGDTILGHPTSELYTKRVSQPPIDLPQLVEAAREADWDMFPEYLFRGVRKSAAFKHCAGPEQGGFGWIVGVGIDNPDLYETVDELEGVLWKATALVLATVVLATWAIARRTTRPILALEQHTRRVAGGDLEAQVDVRSRDELGQLAAAFNTMTRDLRESRAKLIKAEKDAAWREMARQVAHEIKNPLTPIQLSVSLLERARDERSSEFDAIFDRTVDLVQRQVANMRQIASDFSAFAGARKPRPEAVDAGALVEEVLALDAAWAAELGVAVERRLELAPVFADPAELRRVLINLVSNALEAMPEGGRLEARVRAVGSGGGRSVEIEIEDSGVGVSDEVRARLFEPYFTTRSGGTGLGLAIASRLVDEMGGRIELLPVPPERGRGTIARVVLPAHDGAAVAS